LDEFGNMGTLPNFQNIITTLRKRNCSISIILQGIKQLNDLYNRDIAETIFDSCASKIFFSGLGVETCQIVERLLGKETVNHKDLNTGKKSLHGRNLMTADEIRRLDRSTIIYIFSNQKPLLLNTRYYKG
jgi:type IV secretion system protein VirD4